MPRTVYEIVGEARSYVKELTDAEKAALGLDKRNELLAKQGIKTSEVFRQQLIEVNALKEAWKGDALAVAALEKKEKELIHTMQRLNGELDDNNAALAKQRREAEEAATGTGRLGESWKGAALAIRGFLALEAVQVIRDLAEAGLNAERSVNLLHSSVGAANREFGDSVGTVEEWDQRVTELSQKFDYLSETAIRQAVTRTVDMTKRLGLNADQMQVVIERAANLAIGKTDLEGAIERVTSALRGEAESAEYLGLSLGETALKTFLVANGFDEKLIPKLSDAQKNQVRYLLLLDQTNEVQDRTNELLDTQAIKIERVSKKWAEAKETLGGLVLDFADWSIWLDLVNGDLELVAAKWKDMFTPGSKFTDELKEQRRVQRDLVHGVMETVDETEEQLTNEERIKRTLEEITKNIKDANTEKSKYKTLLEQEEDRYKELKTRLGELTNKDQDRLILLARQNEIIERQIKLTRQVLIAPDRAPIRIGGVTLDPELTGEARRQAAASQRPKGQKGTGLQEETEWLLPEDLNQLPDAMAEAMDKARQAQTEGLHSMRIDWLSWLSGTEEGLQFLGDVSGQVFGGLASLAKTAFELSGKEQKKYFALFKAFSLAEAVASTYVAINQALATVKPTVPLGIIAAAAVGIAGAANVAKIAATEPGTTGTGGSTPSISVGGGGGIASPGITSRPATRESITGGITAPIPARVAADIDSGQNNAALVAAVERNSIAVMKAVDKIPDTFESRVEGDDIVLSYDRTKTKQERGLGSFA